MYETDQQPSPARRLFLASLGIAAALFLAVGLVLALGHSYQPPTKGTAGAVAVTGKAHDSPGSQPALIAEALRRRANDPASVQVQDIRYSWRTVEDGHTHQYALVSYREKNPFGALTRFERVVRIIDDLAVVWLEGDEARLFGNSSGRWVADSAGPPGAPH